MRSMMHAFTGILSSAWQLLLTYEPCSTIPYGVVLVVNNSLCNKLAGHLDNSALTFFRLL